MLIQGLFRAKFKTQTLDGNGGGCWWLHRQSLGNALPVAILLKGVAWITALDKLSLALVVKIILYVGEVHLNSVLKKKNPQPDLEGCLSSSESLDTTASPFYKIIMLRPDLSVLFRSSTEKVPFLETREGKLGVSGTH